MTMRERLQARPATDSVDLTATLELLSSLTQYAEAGAVQPHTLAQAAQHALEQHGDQIEVLFAVAKLYLSAGDQAEASRVLGRAELISPHDDRVSQLMVEAGEGPLGTPASSRRPHALSSGSQGSPDFDTRVRRVQVPTAADVPPPSVHGPVSSRSTREPTLRSLRALAAALQEQDARAQQDGDSIEMEAEPAPPPPSASPPSGPPLRPTVRMPRVAGGSGAAAAGRGDMRAPGPERGKWGREGMDSRPDFELPQDGPRSGGRGRADAPTPAAPLPRAREGATTVRSNRAATGNLKMLDVSDERRHLDRYELIGEIAAGGMASVYLARLAGVAGFQRFFAIKRLHPHLADEQEFIDMFLDEARLAAGIHHPNVVPILEVGTTDAGYYLVMDYIEGDTLAGVWNRAAASGGLARPIALRVVLDALRGLHAAHELTDPDGNLVDLVHRDCSPQNILVGIDGSSRLTDFGVARASSRLSTTRSATVKGKLAYLSPEQATGRPLDRRADLFGMGVILWESLTGRRLFRADSDGATLSRILVEPVPAVTELSPDIPESVNAVVMTALARDPADRFATAGDMADMLEQVLRDTGDPALYIATQREVETHMRELFGPDIASRREAIRVWSSLATDPSSSGPRSRRAASPAPSHAREANADPTPPSRSAPSSRRTSSTRPPSSSNLRARYHRSEPPRSEPLVPSSKTEPSAESVLATRAAPHVEAAPQVASAPKAAPPEAPPSKRAEEGRATLPSEVAAPDRPSLPQLAPEAAAPVEVASKRPVIVLMIAIIVLALAVIAFVLRSRL